MSLPPFLGKLAHELRVAIYGHVLGSSKPIKPSNSTASRGIDNDVLALSPQEDPKHTVIEACVLATNKLIHKEATHVLYHNKTFRATFPELERLLQNKIFVANVEFIEIADCGNTQGHSDLSGCSKILKKLQQLPRIRSAVILSDCLNGLILHDMGRWRAYTGTQFIKVPFFVQNVLGLGLPTCVDIGKYQLHGEYSRVQVVNRRLTAMWPSAQAVPVDYDAWADLESLTQKWKVLDEIPNQMVLTLQTSFRCWVGLHEELASMEASGKLRELFEQDANGSVSDLDMAKIHIVKEWSAATLHSRLTGRRDPQDTEQPATLNLRHLKPGDDPNTLSWATEYLAANVAVFGCDRSTNTTYVDAAAQHWAEVDGGMHTIERRIEEQKLAFAGLPNPSYLLEPVRKASLLSQNHVKRYIERLHLDRLATSSVAGLDPVEYLQLSHLSVAIVGNFTQVGLPQDANYPREHDEWAADYLRRHLLVSEWVDPDVVQDMCLEDMRQSLSMLLEHFVHSTHSLKEVRSDPPEGIDADLFLPLAWRWSWEYANLCMEYHEGGQEDESSSFYWPAGSASGSDGEGED